MFSTCLTYRTENHTENWVEIYPATNKSEDLAAPAHQGFIVRHRDFVSGSVCLIVIMKNGLGKAALDAPVGPQGRVSSGEDGQARYESGCAEEQGATSGAGAGSTVTCARPSADGGLLNNLVQVTCRIEANAVAEGKPSRRKWPRLTRRQRFQASPPVGG